MIAPPYDGCTIDKHNVITCPHVRYPSNGDTQMAIKKSPDYGYWQFPQHPVEGQRWWKYVFSRGRWQLMVGKR